MPPKTPPVNQELKELHENAVKMETNVNGLLHHGAIQQAQRVFDRDWQDAMLADLPLRHSFLLDQPDREGIHKLIDLVEDSKEFELVLLRGLDRRRKNAIAIGLVGHDAIIGWLPEDVLTLLHDTGEYAEIYEPKILAIRGIQSGKIEFEMEIVRPDFHQCPACEQIHAGEQDKCEECLSTKRRKKPKREATPEAPAVPVAQAFHNIAEANHNQKQ